jgi:hypothetical protein
MKRKPKICDNPERRRRKNFSNGSERLKEINIPS